MNYLEIYTDASFNDNKTEEKYIGGIGIVCVEKNDTNNISNIAYKALRYTKEDIKKICDYPDIPFKNDYMELYSVLLALQYYLPFKQEIHLYTDDLISYLLFTKDISICDRLLKFRPNERFIFEEFIKEYSAYPFNVHISKIKGHSGIFYNSMADYLAKYWLDEKTALKRASACTDNETLNLIKKHTNLERKNKRKGIIYPYEEYYEYERKLIDSTFNPN